MSQAGKFIQSGPTPGTVLFLEGNTGGNVGPDGGGVIHVVGDGSTVNVAGNAGTNTLTISTTGAVATTYDADSGSAVPSAGILNVIGGALGLATININTVGSGNTLDINLNDDVTLLGFLFANGNVTTGSNFNMPATTADGLHGTFILGGDRFITALGAGNSNTFVGALSGNYTLNTVTTLGNVGLGADTLALIASGEGNIAIGWTALAGLGTADNNIAIGNDAMGVFSGGGDGNIALGANALDALGTGEFNVSIGYNSGTALNGTEDSNVYINNVGVVGENNTMRLGTSGAGQRQVSNTYIAGIDGVNVGSVASVVSISGDHLGSTTITAGSNITVTPGANTITIAATGSTGGAETFHTDSGDATAVANAITVAGGNNIGTTGAGSTVTINLDGTTNHTLQVGNASGSLTSLAAATNGQLPIGSTGADPVIATLTAGTGIGITNGAGSITIAASAATPLVFHTGSGDATPAANALTVAGGNNISTSGSGSTVTVAVSGTTNHAIQVGNASGSLTSLTAATNGQIPIGSTGADPVIAAITAGTGISVTNGAGSITIAATGASFTWSEVTGTSQAMAVNNGYILNNGSLVTATLPSTAAIGDIVRVTGKGAGGWRIAQNAGQTIFFGSSTTTTGAGGRLDSTATRDTVELICVTANNDWNVLSSIGNITVT